MAIELISTVKQSNGLYSVTVQDTAQQIGTDEKSQPIYKKYTLQHNPNQTADELKVRIEKLIMDDQENETDAEAVETAVKTTVESIDPSELSAEEG